MFPLVHVAGIRHAAVSPGQAKNLLEQLRDVWAETLRLHGAKLMELSRKEFAPSERCGSVAGVYHASSCAIWQSERKRFFLSDTTLKKQSNSQIWCWSRVRVQRRFQEVVDVDVPPATSPSEEGNCRQLA
jgi:hypothetical protein